MVICLQYFAADWDSKYLCGWNYSTGKKPTSELSTYMYIFEYRPGKACEWGYRSLPLQWEAWYSLLVLHKIYFLKKKKVVHLPCAYAEDYAIQEYRAFFEMTPVAI